MRKKSELEERLLAFSVSVLKLVDNLPKTAEGRRMAEEVVQNGPTAGVRYARARAAFSPRDFVDDLWGVYGGLIDANAVIEELAKRKMVEQKAVSAIQKACEELCKLVEAKICVVMDDLAKPRRDKIYEPPV